ncbi:hypothetical protein H7F33_04210 [Pedobacter sp. PAMC26386]|nr:hypothetical protein H7F33_04210 [Pedobacter sp. PAMC26386]
MILNRKNLRYIIITILFLGVSSFGEAQELVKANFRISPETATISTVVFRLGELDFRIDQQGEIYFLNKGTKRNTEWSDYTDDEYYDDNSGEETKGKPKVIGGLKLEYYDRYAGDGIIGKIKSIGATRMEYYDRYAGDEKKGKIKSIGGFRFDYFDRYAGDEKKGKMKSFGDNRIEYFDRYTSAEKQGKLISIGAAKIEYHDKNNAPATRIGKIKSIKGNTPKLYVTIDWKNRMSDFND